MTQDRRFYISSCEASDDLHFKCFPKALGRGKFFTLDPRRPFQGGLVSNSKQTTPENYSIFQHIALNIIRRNTSIEASVKRKRNMAALNGKVRSTLIRGLI